MNVSKAYLGDGEFLGVSFSRLWKFVGSEWRFGFVG